MSAYGRLPPVFAGLLLVAAGLAVPLTTTDASPPGTAPTGNPRETDMSMGGPALAFEERADGAFAASVPGGALVAHQGGLTLHGDSGTAHVTFSGAGVPSPEGRLPGVVNDLRGDPSEWRVGLGRYAQVVYPAVAPGVDVVVYVTPQEGLEFDFLLEPFADPAAARFVVSGATVSITGDGALSLGGIRLEPPIAYQDNSEIDAHFVQDGDEVRIQVAAYDVTRPLRIDPKIEWSGYHGGTSSDYAIDVASWDGDVFIAGHTFSGPDTSPPYTNFPIKDAYDATLSSTDAYIARLDGATGQLVWSTYFGGTSTDYLSQVFVDGSGVYAVGSTASTAGFPVSADAYQAVAGTGYDAYLVELSLDGTQLLYGSYLAGSGGDYGMAVERYGDLVYMAGHTYQGTTAPPVPFPTTSNAYQQMPDTSYSTSAYDLFFTVLDLSQQPADQLVYSTLFGAAAYEYAVDLDIGPDGTAYIAGSSYTSGATTGTDIPTRAASGGPPYQSTTTGSTVDYNPFVARFDPTQSGAASLVYSTYVRGTDSNYAVALALSTSGEAYLMGLGLASGTDVVDLTGQTGWDNTNAGYENWIVRVSPDGDAATAATYYGRDWGGCCTYYEYGMDIEVDDSGRVIMASVVDQGNDASATTGFSTAQPWRNHPWQNYGSRDVIVARFSPDLKSRDYHFVTGSSSLEVGILPSSSYGTYGGMTLLDGEPVVHYITSSGSVPVTPGAYDKSVGGYEAVAVRLGYLPPVPVITATHESVSGTTMTKGTTDGSIRSFTGTIDEWQGDHPPTYSTYTLTGVDSMFGDSGDGLDDITWEWDIDGDLDFDDGVSDVAFNVTSASSGSYLYCLRGTDEHGVSAKTCISLPFRNRVPDVAFEPVPGPLAPVCIGFVLDSSDTVDRDASVTPGLVRYDWDIDPTDGVVEYPDGPAVLPLRFEERGVRVVNLKVWDEEGEFGELTKEVDVSGEGVDAIRDEYSVLQGHTLQTYDRHEDGVLANDCGIYGATTLSARLASDVPAAAGSMVAFDLDGTFTFQSKRDFAGDVELEYVAWDGDGNSAYGTLVIHVLERNGAPAAHDVHIEVQEDAPASITLTATDDQGTLQFEVLDDIAGLTGAAPDLVYTPPADTCHADPGDWTTFGFRVHDPHGLSDDGTVTVEVVCAQDPPGPQDDVFSVPVSGTKILDVLANDAEADGDDLAITATGPAEGVAEIQGDRLAYMAPAVIGLDKFTYDVSDGTDTATAEVTVSVYDPADNVPPTAHDVTMHVIESTETTIQLQGSDVDDHPKTLVFEASSAMSLVDVEGDTLVYLGPVGVCDVRDVFDYTVRDPSGNVASAKVDLTIVCRNDAPVAHDDAATSTGGSVAVRVLENDEDADGDALSIVGVGSALGGRATVEGDRIVFVPDEGMSGPTSFAYTITDGEFIDSATVTVETLRASGAGAVTDHASMLEDSELVLDVLANDQGFDPVLLSVEGGALLRDGAVVYWPPQDFVGMVELWYTMEAEGIVSRGRILIDVEPENDVPVAEDDSYTTEGALHVSEPGVLGNDLDVDSLLDAKVLRAPSHGSLELISDGGFLYTPHHGFVGEDSFTYVAGDGLSVDAATVALSVVPPSKGAAPKSDVPVVVVETPGFVDLVVDEGDVVRLDALVPRRDVDVAWVQVAGPQVGLTGDSFTAPLVEDEVVLGFQLMVVKGGASWVDASVRVRVVESNSAPVVVDRDVSTTPGMVRLALEASDGDGDALRYAWRQVEGDEVAFSSTSAVTPAFNASTGVYVFELEVSDGLESAVGRVTVTVKDMAPVVASFTAAKLEGGQYWLSAPHVDGASYTWFIDGQVLEGREVKASLGRPTPVTLTVRDAHGTEHPVTQQIGNDPVTVETQEAPSSPRSLLWPVITGVAIAVLAAALFLRRRR